MRRAALSIIAVLYTIAAFCWTMPNNVPFREQINSLSRPAFRYLGLWQSWEMFTPQPPSDDIYVTAMAHYKDGTQKDLNICRMHTMGYIERYQKERWRKWGSEYLRLDANKQLWEPTSRYFAQQMKGTDQSPLIKLELVRHWRQIYELPHQRKPSSAEKPWNRFIFHIQNFQTPEKKVETEKRS